MLGPAVAVPVTLRRGAAGIGIPARGCGRGRGRRPRRRSRAPRGLRCLARVGDDDRHDERGQEAEETKQPPQDERSPLARRDRPRNTREPDGNGDRDQVERRGGPG